MKKLVPQAYVAAMFHPTIGQCAHQSLSSTATTELGMIPTRNKGTVAGSHIAKDISKSNQAKTTFGFKNVAMENIESIFLLMCGKRNNVHNS